MKKLSITLLSGTILISLLLQACKEDPPSPPLFGFETVNGFVISNTGEKLLATDNGLCILDEAKGTYFAVENDLEESPVYDLTYSAGNPGQELWLASHLGAYNFSQQYFYNEANSGLFNDQLGQIGFNPDNIGFFASPDGISVLNNNNWTRYQGLNDFFLRHEISDIGSASNGYTYVTTRGGGVERFKADADGISGATLMDTDWTWMESNYIHSVYIDDTTQVYGTNAGVAFHFSEYTKWDWEVYTTSDGLINDTVLSVVRDRSGKWWIGTANGISRFDETGWVNFPPEEYELTDRRIKYLAIDIDGSIWMASDQGLSRYSDGTWQSYPR